MAGENHDELGQFLSEVAAAAPVPTASRAERPRSVPKRALALGAVVLTSLAVMSLVLRAPSVERVVTAAVPPAPRVDASATSAPPPAIPPAPLEAVSPSVVEADAPPRAAVAPPPEGAVDAAVDADEIKAMWRETDTRSLDRALSAVRRATLALRRCNVAMTSVDQAVARCDVVQADGGSARRDVAWIIEFRRADDLWQIESISAR